METVKVNPVVKTRVFLTKKKRVGLIDRMDVTKADLINKMNAIRIELIDRNK